MLQPSSSGMAGSDHTHGIHVSHPTVLGMSPLTSLPSTTTTSTLPLSHSNANSNQCYEQLLLPPSSTLRSKLQPSSSSHSTRHHTRSTREDETRVEKYSCGCSRFYRNVLVGNCHHILSPCITIMNVILILFILQGLFGLFSSFILLYTSGDNIIQRSYAKKKIQMSLVVDYQISEMIKTTTLTINQLLKDLDGMNLNDEMRWIVLFKHIQSFFEQKLPLQISYFGRFDHYFLGVERTYIRKFEKTNNPSLVRAMYEYNMIDDLSKILDPSNIRFSQNSTFSVTARPWYHLFLNATNPKILWSPLFFSFVGQPSMTASIPIYISQKISSIHSNNLNQSLENTTIENNNSYTWNTVDGYENYTEFKIYRNESAPRNPSHLYGVIGLQLNLDKLANTLDQSARNAGVAIAFIINSYGEIVASTNLIVSSSSLSISTNISSLMAHSSSGTPSNSSQNIVQDLMNEVISRGFLKKITEWHSLNFERQDFNDTAAIKDWGSFLFYHANTPNLEVFQYTITDQYGLNWGSVIAIPHKSFVDEVMSGSISSVVIFSVVLFLGVFILITVIQCIQMSLRYIKKQLREIVQFKSSTIFHEKKSFNLLYDIRQMQQSLNTMKSSLTIFSKYVPNSVTKRLSRQQRMTLQSMTVMCIDLHGFSLLPDHCGNLITNNETMFGMDRVNFVSLATELFTELYGIIENSKGIVDKYTKDRIIAFWNDTSCTVEDHERKACMASCEIKMALDRLNAQWLKRRFLQNDDHTSLIRPYIGVNSGSILCGNIGSQHRICFTVLGDGVNITSSLPSLNPKFGTKILIGENTYDRVKSHFICYFVDYMVLKGKQKPLKVYSLEMKIEEATEEHLKLRDYLNEIEACLFSMKFDRILEICQVINSSQYSTHTTSHPATLEITSCRFDVSTTP
ncbi:hypothetical protein C9374_011336 [Naegleria lovaniensis]|uniref:Guanylate cyclase domain-containing protein n=1 Tax=Naegleria lovaniensis TaxID=51637 RepID=A0AA88H231_NAELO|nr:uncharacterized protein C9374_011336 [Naegleria lovaniensis]KAG2392611.1 hypothetical protein C9374_011336 [Naegleria lovaniensis]